MPRTKTIWARSLLACLTLTGLTGCAAAVVAPMLAAGAIGAGAGGSGKDQLTEGDPVVARSAEEVALAQAPEAITQPPPPAAPTAAAQPASSAEAMSWDEFARYALDRQQALGGLD